MRIYWTKQPNLLEKHAYLLVKNSQIYWITTIQIYRNEVYPFLTPN